VGLAALCGCLCFETRRLSSACANCVLYTSCVPQWRNLAELGVGSRCTHASMWKRCPACLLPEAGCHKRRVQAGAQSVRADANDAAQFAELKTQGDLTRRAWARDVQVGPLYPNLQPCLWHADADSCLH
jgi:hypothetical protein